MTRRQAFLEALRGLGFVLSAYGVLAGLYVAVTAPNGFPGLLGAAVFALLAYVCVRPRWR